MLTFILPMNLRFGQESPENTHIFSAQCHLGDFRFRGELRAGFIAHVWHVAWCHAWLLSSRIFMPSFCVLVYAVAQHSGWVKGQESRENHEEDILLY